jgi:hypothetical protein
MIVEIDPDAELDPVRLEPAVTPDPRAPEPSLR